MFLKHPGKALALSTLLLAAGCSSTGGVHKDVGSFFQSASTNSIKIDSDPSGAAVYVMGEKLGVTPLVISRKDIYPNTYPKEKESLYGTVTLKKAGCSDFIKTVTPEITEVGLHAKLECGDMNPASSKTTKDVPLISKTVEQRLDKIRDLLNKGLITEEEAEKARARVLNDL